MVLLDCVLTLVVFGPVLVKLGRSIQPTPRPGSWLVLLCVAVALVGVVVSVVLGWQLVGLEVQNQRVEAELRKALVLTEERAKCPSDAYTSDTADTAVDWRRQHASASLSVQFKSCLNELRNNYVKLYNRFAVFSLWLGGYEQAVVLLPYLIVAPLLYATEGRVTLGKVTQTSHAFSNVFDALSVLADRWVDVTEFMSVVMRLRQWETMLGEGVDAILMEIAPVSSTST